MDGTGEYHAEAPLGIFAGAPRCVWTGRTSNRLNAIELPVWDRFHRCHCQQKLYVLPEREENLRRYNRLLMRFGRLRVRLVIASVLTIWGTALVGGVLGPGIGYVLIGIGPAIGYMLLGIVVAALPVRRSPAAPQLLPLRISVWHDRITGTFCSGFGLLWLVVATRTGLLNG